MQGRRGEEGAATIGHDAPAAALVRHLAILVVYYLKDNSDLPLLELHLQRIAQHTHVPYTLFAVANRVSPEAREIIRAQPHVVECDITPTDARGSREHGYYLDAMLRIALTAGVTHVCTLDVDSFPIDDRWLDVLVAKMPPSGVVGILRRENGDVALAHPSCILATREFFGRFSPSFSPDAEDTNEFRRFLRTTGQAADTGIRLTAALWNAEEPWGQLTRSNAVDPHYLMAGIYDDVVFHLGGVSRGSLFRADLQQSRRHQLTRPIERLPARGKLLARWKRAALAKVRRSSERRLANTNRRVFNDLRSRLLDDPDALFAYLRGGRAPAEADQPDAQPSSPTPTEPSSETKELINTVEPALPAEHVDVAHVEPVDDLELAPLRAARETSEVNDDDEWASSELPRREDGHDRGVVEFPVPVVADAPPPELRYRRALELGAALRSLARSRGIVWALVVRQLRAQYSQQVLGLAWAILTPLAQTLLFTLILHRFNGKAGINTGGVPNALFLYVGLTAWSFYSSSLSSGGTSLVGNPLLNKVYAPREVFPLSQVASSAINAVAAALVLPVLMLAVQRGPSVTIYWTAILALPLLAFTVAVTLVVSAITVYLRDLRSGLPLILQLAMFFPGVLYPVRTAFHSAAWRGLYALLLPAWTLIDQIRETMFHHHAPAVGFTLLATAGSIVYLIGGFVFFKRLETGFADVS